MDLELLHAPGEARIIRDYFRSSPGRGHMFPLVRARLQCLQLGWTSARRSTASKPLAAACRVSSQLSSVPSK